MSVEANKQNIRRHVDEIWHKGNMEAVDELISPNWVLRNPEGNDITGIDGFKQMAISQRTSFPDIYFKIDNMIGEGDYVAVQYTSTGTFKNKMVDIEPTGKKYEQPIVIIYRFESGKQVETWISYNQISMFRQLGIPIPNQ
jgi:predicted ester cyclase